MAKRRNDGAREGRLAERLCKSASAQAALRILSSREARIARRMTALEFDTREEYEEYRKQHEIEKGTKVHIKQEEQRSPKEEKPVGLLPKHKEPEKSEAENQKPQGQKGFFSKKEMALPDVAVQPVKTKDEVYGSAKEAQEQMMDWLDRGKGIDSKLGLKHYDLSNLEVKQKGVDYDEPGPILITAAPKGEKRAREKVEADYGGDWSRLTDAVRATIAVDKFEDVDKVMSVLRKSGMKLAKRPKDRFQRPTMVGYRDVMMNVEYPNGHIGELQVHIKPMLKAKSEGHKLYEKVRDIEAKLKKEGKESLTPDEQKAYEDANRQMSDLYNKAWEKSQRKRASMRTAEKDKVRYFDYNGNPAEWISSKVPVMWVKGKRTPIYDMFRFVHESEEIGKAKFDRMMAGKGRRSGFVGQTLDDGQVQDIAEKVVERLEQSGQPEGEPEGSQDSQKKEQVESEPEGQPEGQEEEQAEGQTESQPEEQGGEQPESESGGGDLLALDEEVESVKASNGRSDMDIQGLIVASVVSSVAFRRFAQLSEEDKAKVVEKVVEKVKAKGGEVKDKAGTDDGEEDKVIDKDAAEADASSGEEGSTAEVGMEDEEADAGDDGIKGVVDGLVKEVEAIKGDGKVTHSEVVGLVDSIVKMVNSLLVAKPGRARKSALAGRVREEVIAGRVVKAGHSYAVGRLQIDVEGWQPVNVDVLRVIGGVWFKAYDDEGEVIDAQMTSLGYERVEPKRPLTYQQEQEMKRRHKAPVQRITGSIPEGSARSAVEALRKRLLRDFGLKIVGSTEGR